MADPRPPIFEGVGLRRHYSEGNVEALRGVSFAIAEGEFVALVGPSGSGKSTLLHLLGGLDRPSAGELRFRGQPYAALGDLAAFRLRLAGFMFQAFHLLPTLTARENLLAAMAPTGRPRGERLRRADELLAAMGVAHRAGALPNTLSTGEKQRVALARALANEPTALLGDEPTGNLDSANGAAALAMLQRLHRERGMTIVLATHSPEVAAAADRVLELRDGQMV